MYRIYNYKNAQKVGYFHIFPYTGGFCLPVKPAVFKYMLQRADLYMYNIQKTTSEFYPVFTSDRVYIHCIIVYYMNS